MLTALELAGFKSFADKTRFDFPDGITVIVGPNGSGKSNVVDAIKWVLGAQSAKALRGKEMTDVIFKGSSSDGRKACNSAEATLVFDNSEKLLGVDAEEVHVTRRVYRSGEGEYLINKEPCRLKDIRNLFRGTGVGVDAYSLIEQGKVDRMLQASPKDRRVIFEEAAGISRFNAKKLEAARRLDRVEQNLTRLKDIVDEVHARLSRLKSQASKAQKYREMTSRLQDVRLRLGWTEYSQLQSSIETTSLKLESFSQDFENQQQALAGAEELARAAEMNLHGVAESCQEVESRLQETLQKIAVFESQQTALRAKSTESEEEQARYVKRLLEHRARLKTVQEEVTSNERQVAAAQAEFDAAAEDAQIKANAAESLREQLAQQNRSYEELREQHIQCLREFSNRNAAAERHKNQLAEIALAIEALEVQVRQNEKGEQEARQAAKEADEQLREIQERYEQLTTEAANIKAQRNAAQAELATRQEQAALIQGRLAGAAERIEILEELERHLDGVDAGARKLIDLAKTSEHPAFQGIEGLVADLLTVKDVELAEHVDTALGPIANMMVVEDGRLFKHLREEKLEFPGRLSLIRLDRVPARRFAEKIQLDGVQGIVGRADRLVRCKNKYMPLIRYLLGATWLVDTIEDALGLSHFRGAGLRFVTTHGELVEPDGTLTLGAKQSASGLVSRRSELSKAQDEIKTLQQQLADAQTAIKSNQAEVERLAPASEASELELKTVSEELVRKQAEQQTAIRKLDEIEVDAGLLATKLVGEISRRTKIEPQISEFEEHAFRLQNQISELETQVGEFESDLRGGDERLRTVGAAATESKVELARREQILESLRQSSAAGKLAQQERLQAVEDTQAEIDRLVQKQNDSELGILDLSSQLAEMHLRSQAEEKELDDLAVEAAHLRAARASTARELDTAKRRLDKLTQQQETCGLELQRHEESSRGLLKRFAEDYEITLEQLSASEVVDGEAELAGMEQEAAQLRQDISSVGEINMAALAELDELQERYDYLNGQYEDLEAAKESLQRIIQKINHDSRRMFTETLEIIRQNFQKLYRKSFGGGTADILLEEGEDVLDCGIDIIATPPGKTALSNSLLSGGEKALTAVALLLAIFQYRPSPFCVLDEVDAPFDEANIGRFVSVLHEFLDWTKFIIVTHSKKTMTAATTLYGVTMQESGVSKQVAVKFEDVDDKGEIINPDKKAA